ncbi:hypothetical protein Tco_0116456 [Tanacetum coccineum]
MGSIDDIKSILTQSALDALCEKYHIPRTVHPELPGHVLEYFQINLPQLSVIAAAKISHFEILCRVHNFVPTVGNFSIFYINSKNKGWMSFRKRSDTGPVCHTGPLDSLKHWNNHFFWVDASVFPLVVPWHSNKTLRKEPHPTPAEFNADVCDYLAENPAPFRRFSEPFLYLVGISQYYDLDDNCYLTFLTDDDEGGCSLLASFNFCLGEVPLLESARGRVVPLAGVNQGNQNEVVPDVGNQNDNAQDVGNSLIEGSAVDGQEIPVDAGVIRIDDEVPDTVAEKPKVQNKRRRADGASGSSHPPKKLREDHDISGDVGASTGGKSLAAIQELFEQSTLNVEVGVTAAATVPFVTSFVTPTSERGDSGPTDSVFVANLRTQRPSERFIISSDSSHDSSANGTDDEVTSIVRSFVPPPPLMIAAVVTTVVVDTSSVSVPRAGHEPVHHTLFADSASMGEAHPDVAGPSHPAGTELSTDSFYVSQDLDSETLHQAYDPKWNVTNNSALDDPDVWRTARQTCLNSEVRLRLEHELRGGKKFEGKCAMQADLLKKRDAEIASLKAQLSLKEAEATEAIRLRGQVATVKAAKTARVSELDGLKERNATLEGQVVALKSAAVVKDTELASSSAQIAKLTHDLSNFQLSCEELSIKVASLESEKDKIIDQVFTLEGTCSGLRDKVLGYRLFKEQIEVVQDEQVKMLSDKVASMPFTSSFFDYYCWTEVDP